MSKKQNSVSLSTAETEYITVGSYCSQLLWMKKLLTDYEITQDTMVIYCDNSSVIDISKNPVQHFKTKHIEIRYLFIRDLIERKIVCFKYISIEHQNADIFTKPLDRSKFETLRQVIGVNLCPWSFFGFYGPCASLLYSLWPLLLAFFFSFLFFNPRMKCMNVMQCKS